MERIRHEVYDVQEVDPEQFTLGMEQGRRTGSELSGDLGADHFRMLRVRLQQRTETSLVAGDFLLQTPTVHD